MTEWNADEKKKKKNKEKAVVASKIGCKVEAKQITDKKDVVELVLQFGW